jgi:mannose-6-phosphate isomerase-like protein (cupin superfamily)
MAAKLLSRYPAHLGLGARIEIEPAFEGAMDWYMAYGERHADDGVEGRLVSMHTFAGSWPTWEMHPNGHELVLCVSGSLTMHQEHADGGTDTVTLNPGEYAVNPPGTWHTADVDGEATGVFITAGVGTEIRPRE